MGDKERAAYAARVKLCVGLARRANRYAIASAALAGDQRRPAIQRESMLDAAARHGHSRRYFLSEARLAAAMLIGGGSR